MSPGVYPTFMHKKKLSRKNSKSHSTNKPRLNYLDIGVKKDFLNISYPNLVLKNKIQE